MGLQAHPCNNKRTFEGLEEPAGRAQHNLYQSHHSAARSPKQQCTIRVGVEAPDHLAASHNTASTTILPSCTETWYSREHQLQQPNYESYVTGFNAAEMRASTPFASSVTAVSAPSPTYPETVPAAASEYTAFHNGSDGVYSNQTIYQNLASMVPPAESLTDRFERVCSSPRPYVSDPVSATAPLGYGSYGGAAAGATSTTASATNAATNEATMRAAAEERYWSFGYTSQCPKKSTSSYGKCSSYGYGENGGFKAANGYQQIQRDENGKSYLELGSKAAVQPEWRPMWPAPAGAAPLNNTTQPQQQQHQHQQQQQPQQLHYNNSSSPAVKSCSKCGHVLNQVSQRTPTVPAQACYRHQRLSVLSLSMLKLNRYRQCSDPSLHRSVLICNTLRHIEDEMEREGLVCNPVADTASSSTTAAVASTPVANCDTCCCSHCGTVLNNGNSAVGPGSGPGPASASSPTHKLADNANTRSSPSAAAYETPPEPSSFSSAAAAAAASVANADEDDSGFGDEDSRDIDWSSVFSMSTASAFDLSGTTSTTNNSGSHNTALTSATYLCSDSNSSSATLFAESSEMMNDSGHHQWKTNGSNSSWSSASDASDFSGVRWKNDLGDELEGFVHILVGS